MEIKSDLSKCHFVPMSTMQKVKQLLECRLKKTETRCKLNLLDLQQSILRRRTNDYCRKRWRDIYQIALAKAVHTHDWNKVLYLLKMSPIWEHSEQQNFELSIYVRALTILLMNHPNSRSQGFLNDYLHMVLACRSDHAKRAALKVVLSLQDKIRRTARASKIVYTD